MATGMIYMLMINRKLATRLEKVDALHSAAIAVTHHEINPLIETDVQPISDGTMVYGGDGMPINRAIGLGTDTPVTDDNFEQIEQFFANYDTASQIDLCPLADYSLLNLLAQHQYKPLKIYSVLVRTLPLDDYDTPESEAHVAPADDAQMWIQTVSQGFLGKDEIPEGDLSTMFARIAFRRPDTYCHIARMNGVPVGGGAVAIIGKIAVFFSTSTRREYRRKGVQAALMKTRFDLAEEMGCELAMGLAVPGSTSERNLQRGGFRIAYTKVVFTL